MKLPAILKSITLIEIVVIVIFILYIVFPVPTPAGIAPYIESPLGMVSILLVLVYLFLKSNPILAVLFIFVGYELLRRSGKNSSILVNAVERRADPRAVLTPTVVSEIEQHPADHDRSLHFSDKDGQTNAYIQYTQPTAEREQELVDANIPLNSPILEVEIVQEMAPVGTGEAISFAPSDFKPVSDNLKGASDF